MSIADAVLTYISSLTVGQGRLQGQPFEVLPWERKFCRAVLKPGMLQGGLSMGRGNGKTAFVAALATSALDGPLAFRGSEVGLVASSKEQARISYRHVVRYLGPEKYQDKKGWRYCESQNDVLIENRKLDIVLQVKAAEPRALHGMAPKLLLLDEPSQWMPTKVDAMFAALTTSLGKQPDSLLLALGTRAAEPGHPFSRLLDKCDYKSVYAASPKADFRHYKTWLQANPSLPIMPDLEAAIRGECLDAQKDPNLRPSFDALRLNTGVSDVRQANVLSPDVWQGIESDKPRQGRPVYGVDLGGEAASSAIAAYWAESGRLECVAAFAGKPSLAERARRDGVGDLYALAAARGELLTLGEHVVDWAALLNIALDRFGRPSALAADRYRQGDLLEALKASNIPITALELRGGGYVDGAEDLRLFRRAALDGRCYPLKNLYLTSCFAGARAIQNSEGIQKLAKGGEAGRRVKVRDDGAAASLLAVGLGERRRGLLGRRVYHGAV